MRSVLSPSPLALLPLPASPPRADCACDGVGGSASKKGLERLAAAPEWHAMGAATVGGVPNGGGGGPAPALTSLSASPTGERMEWPSRAERDEGCGADAGAGGGAGLAWVWLGTNLTGSVAASAW